MLDFAILIIILSKINELTLVKSLHFFSQILLFVF